MNMRNLELNLGFHPFSRRRLAPHRLLHQAERREARDHVEIRRHPARAAAVGAARAYDDVLRHLDLEVLQVGVERRRHVALRLGQEDLLVLRLGLVLGRQHLRLGAALGGDRVGLEPSRACVRLLDVELGARDRELLLLLDHGEVLQLALLDRLALRHLLRDVDLALHLDRAQLLLALGVLHRARALDLLLELLGVRLRLGRLLFLHRLDALGDEALLVHQQPVQIGLGSRVANQHLGDVDAVLGERVLGALRHAIVLENGHRLPHQLLGAHELGARAVGGSQADGREVGLLDLDLPALGEVDAILQLISELGLELVQAALEELLAGVLRRRDHRHV
mmetsp:Transcript_2029/g.6627  ORF Transcript_2029/g.6627 Transcript_2029/m.6627 type:complete len:337 (+) Transcript_2029:86-1096(+)